MKKAESRKQKAGELEEQAGFEDAALSALVEQSRAFLLERFCRVSVRPRDARLFTITIAICTQCTDI